MTIVDLGQEEGNKPASNTGYFKHEIHLKQQAQDLSEGGDKRLQVPTVMIISATTTQGH